MKHGLVALTFAGLVLAGCRDEPGHITRNQLVCDRYNNADPSRSDCAESHRELTVQAPSGTTYTVRTATVEYYDLQPGDSWPVPSNARASGRP